MWKKKGDRAIEEWGKCRKWVCGKLLEMGGRVIIVEWFLGWEMVEGVVLDR